MTVRRVATALALVVAVAGSLVAARALALRDSVLPGVSVAGVDVGGLERSRARARLATALAGRLAPPVTVALAGRSFRVRPDRIFELDVAAMADAAFAAGRDSPASYVGALVTPFLVSNEVDPVVRVRPDGRRLLARRLAALARPPVSARVSMKGFRAVVAPSRAGVTADGRQVTRALRAAAFARATRVEARTFPRVPPVTTVEAEVAAEQARTAVSAPVAVKLGGERLGTLDRRRLADLVRFRRVRGGLGVFLARADLLRSLGPLVAPKTGDPVDASFEVVGKRVRVVPSRPGTRLAQNKAARTVLAAALRTQRRTAALRLAKRPADFTTREAKALGIRHQISTFTTDMGESSPNRIHNVHLLGGYLDGTIVRPGERFSFNEVMGPRTPERGFREGQMIFAGVLIPSIGGGVCQTATTIFNAAFEAGLPILERRNHSFYISHYPVGRDATVSWGGPDLVFRNDLENSILIKASWTNSTFTVTFYGTGQGRKVVATTSTPTNYTQPKLQYAIDPSAPARSLRRTEAGGPGFDVNVHRKVYEGGKRLREDDFFTRYVPENPTAVYGPGRTPPGAYFYLPPSA